MKSEKQYYCERHKVILYIPFCPLCEFEKMNPKKKKSKK